MTYYKDMENNNNVVYALAVIIALIVSMEEAYLGNSDTTKLKTGEGTFRGNWAYWSFIPLIVMLLATGFIWKVQPAQNVLNMMTLLFIVYMSSTIIQQQLANAKNTDGKCEYTQYNNILVSNTGFTSDENDKQSGPRHRYMIIYGFSLLALMVLCWMRFETGESTLQWPFSRVISQPKEFYLILAFPILLPFLTETISTMVNAIAKDGKKEFSVEHALSNFMDGKSFSDTDKSNIPWIGSGHFIFTSLFMLFLFMVMWANSTGGFNGEFTRLGTNNSNWSITIMIYLLVFLSVILRYIFLQDCSIEIINRDTSDDRSTDNNLTCKISKYGGILPLLMISFISLYIYNVKGFKDRLYALILMISLIFGFSELFHSLKNKQT